jgi:predicted PurR-regulated permease PerM
VAVDHRLNPGTRNTALVAVAVIAALYFGRVVLIPFALAILLCFLLTPLVLLLRRWKFGRRFSVVCAVSLAFLAISGLGVLVSLQMTDLAHQLPQYQQNIEKKVHSVRVSSSGAINRLSRAVHDFGEELTPPSPKANPGEQQPVPVEIRRSPFSPLEMVRRILGSLINILLTSAIVIVLTIFMLFQREDLRYRLIRLAGSRRINVTTSALDDAAHRVSRYLVAQLGLNVAFGAIGGVGLYFMHVPNPVLWGALAAMFRYIPYLGIWLAAVMPAAVALATAPGWWQPLGILVLFGGVDICLINFAEPVLYGNSTGISPMAILVAALFWTWLWGPIGLLLSTPLTVCLVVLGRHVPSLDFLTVLLGDEPVLGAEKRLYQRLLAMDVEEATEVAEEFLKEKKSLTALYDDVVVPALMLAEEDRHHGKLDNSRQQFIFETTRSIVEDMAERADELLTPAGREQSAADRRIELSEVLPVVLFLPARDQADEIAGLMLARLLEEKGVSCRAVSSATLDSERLEATDQAKVQIVCVSAIPPFGYLHARYLCKRLRARFPEVKIIAAVLTHGDVQDLKKRQPPVPADELATSLSQAVAEVLALVPAEQRLEQTAFSS